MLSLFAFPSTATGDLNTVGLPPEITAQQYVLMDAATGQILLQKNMNQTVHPASTTKIVTVALALSSGILPVETVTVSDDAIKEGQAGASQHIAINYGEKLSLQDLMYATLLYSANDAANALAETVAGRNFPAGSSPTFSEKIAAFAEMMNDFARSAGAKNTNFVNPHGMYLDDHITTAYDMALIMRKVMSTSGISEMITTVNYKIPATNKKEERNYITTGNNLLKSGEFNYPYCIGGKTGYTEYSGYGFVAMAEKNGRKLIAAVYNCQNGDARFSDAIKLFNYGFDYFKEVTIAAEALPRSTKTVIDGDYITSTATVFVNQPLTVLLHFTMTSGAITVTDNTPESLIANALAPTYTLTLTNPDNPYMHSEIGTFQFTVNVTPLENPKPIQGDKEEEPDTTVENEKKGGTGSTVLLVIFIVILVALAVLIFMYLYSNITRQKRARERRRERLGDRSVHTKRTSLTSYSAAPVKKKTSSAPRKSVPATEGKRVVKTEKEPVAPTGRRYKH